MLEEQDRAESLAVCRPGVRQGSAFACIEKTLDAAAALSDVLPDAHGLVHSWLIRWVAGSRASIEISTAVSAVCNPLSLLRT